MNNPIYQILMIEKPDSELYLNDGRPMGLPDFGDTRDVGFFYELETAVQALNENWGDVQDGGIYHAAYILKHEPGIYPAAYKEDEDRWYFLWDQEKQGYFQAKQPKLHGRVWL